MNFENQNIDISNLKQYDEKHKYQCDTCGECPEKGCIWSYTDGQNKIHLCPTCVSSLSAKVYRLRLDEDKLRRELAMSMNIDIEED